jgi:H+/Cl- antiporter ClcA
MNWGRVLYIAGLGFLVAAFGWWFVSLFELFAEFYKHDGLDLLVMPLFKLLASPLLWIGVVLIKLAGWVSPPSEQSSSLTDNHS